MDKRREKLTKMMQRYVNNVMVNALQVVEDEFGREHSNFMAARQKILKVGNDQKRMVEEILEVYPLNQPMYTMDMEVKDNKKGTE